MNFLVGENGRNPEKNLSRAALGILITNEMGGIPIFYIFELQT